MRPKEIGGGRAQEGGSCAKPLSGGEGKGGETFNRTVWGKEGCRRTKTIWEREAQTASSRILGEPGRCSAGGFGCSYDEKVSSDRKRRTGATRGMLGSLNRGNQTMHGVKGRDAGGAFARAPAAFVEKVACCVGVRRRHYPDGGDSLGGKA